MIPYIEHKYINRVCDNCGAILYSQGLEFAPNDDGTYSVTGTGNCTDTELWIPPTTPEGYSVTSIGEYAFWASSLTSITIPDSVTNIGAYAFWSCSNLTSITIPNSVTNIGELVFWCCRNLTSITIGKGVTSIGANAFWCCDNLTDIYFIGAVEEWNAIDTLNTQIPETTKIHFTECEHAWVNATCTESQVCTKCGEVGEALGHTEETLPAVEATCTENGLTEGEKCSVCGEIFVEQMTIPAKGHIEVIDPAVEATCTTTGLTQGAHCSACGEIFVAQNEIPMRHTKETAIGYEATCTESGLTSGEKCSVCGKILVVQEIIPALGHTEKTLPSVDATCIEGGLTVGTKCSVCGEILVAQEIIPALGHTEETLPAVDATCTEIGLSEGEKCSVCGEILAKQEVLPMLGHDEVSYDAKAPTCSEIGWNAYIACQREGCTYTTKVEQPTIPHNMDGHMCKDCYYPYVAISSVDDLKNVATNISGKYILLNNIDLGGEEWTPIEFTGTFDGNGYKISNFKITGAVGYAGLFGHNVGLIKNLGVEKFTIDVCSNQTYTDIYIYAGGLIGYNRGNVENCYTTGSISAKSASATDGSDSTCSVGGLVGYNSSSGTITNCYTTGRVNSVSSSKDSSLRSASYSYAGGLVGINRGTIRNSYATGDVYSSTSAYNTSGNFDSYGEGYGGGLVGYNNGTIENCYAMGYVSSSALSHDRFSDVCSIAGGLIGYNYSGTITNCYATGEIFSTSSYYQISNCAGVHDSFSGGLIGYNNSGTITNCYATGLVRANSSFGNKYSGSRSYAGGLIGCNGNGTLSSCFRYQGQRVSITKNGETSYSAATTDGTSVDMTTLTSVSFHTDTLGWSDEIWSFTEGTHPVLK